MRHVYRPERNKRMTEVGSVAAGQPSADERDDRDYWEALISEAEAARFPGVSVRAMQNWRVRGGAALRKDLGALHPLPEARSGRMVG
jgi:hypothetical protein